VESDGNRCETDLDCSPSRKCSPSKYCTDK
jgi:hypothetical protein